MRYPLAFAGLLALSACQTPSTPEDAALRMLTATQIAAAVGSGCVTPDVVLPIRVPGTDVTVLVPGAELIARGARACS